MAHDSFSYCDITSKSKDPLEAASSIKSLQQCRAKPRILAKSFPNVVKLQRNYHLPASGTSSKMSGFLLLRPWLIEAQDGASADRPEGDRKHTPDWNRGRGVLRQFCL